MKTILLVGATGKLGGMIAEELLALPGVKLRVLVRPGRDWTKDGVEVVAGEMGDDAAVQGVDVVISAVQGGPDVIVEGQRQLLAAARRAGVRRFIPSDFSYDFFKVTEGHNVNSDWRREFARYAAAEKGSVEVVHFLNGCFLDEGVLFGFLGAIDLSKGESYLWGDGKAVMDFTTYRDSAKYVAAVAVDEIPLPEKIGVAGDRLTFAQLIAATGRPINVLHQGTLADLTALIDARRAAEPSNVFAWLPLQYWRAMLSGEGGMETIENARYPQIRPETVREYVARVIG